MDRIHDSSGGRLTFSFLPAFGVEGPYRANGVLMSFKLLHRSQQQRHAAVGGGVRFLPEPAGKV